MADNVTLPGVGIIRTEDLGGAIEMPITKLHTGANGIDSGSVTPANPLPVQEQSTPITGAVMPAGGTGVIGWLAALEFLFTNKTIRVNSGYLAPGQTPKPLLTRIPASSLATTLSTFTQPYDTVAAGKIRFFTDFKITSNFSAVFEVQFQAGTPGTPASYVNFYSGFCKGDTAPMSDLGLETQPTVAGGNNIQAVITLVSGTFPAGAQIDIYVGAVEQNP